MADNELSESELKNLVNSLTTDCCQVVEKSLLKLHKHFGIPEHFRLSERHPIWGNRSIRDDDFKVKEFYKIGGLANIFQLLLKPNAKWMEKAIHILTICCHVTECNEIIFNTETISLITSLFKKYCKNEIIRVSLCNIILKLCAHGGEELRMAFNNLDISSDIINSLLYSQLSDSDYVATLTLRYLSLTQPLREQIIQTILTKLNPTNNDLMIKILRILAALTRDHLCNAICAQQILTTIGIANLVNYAQSSDKNLQRASVTVLTRISGKSYVISGEIGEAGMVPIYINLIQEFLHDDQMSPLYGLCELLHHVDNRGRLFQTVDGFETLISLLRRWDEFDRLIKETIMIIIFFFAGNEYNESHILKFLNLELFSILVHILDNYVKTIDSTHELIEGTKSVTFTKKGFTNFCYPGTIVRLILVLAAISSKREFHFRFLNSAILDVLLRAWLSGSYVRELRWTENIVMALVRSDVCLEGLILLQFPQMVRKIMDDSALPHSVDSCYVCGHVQLCQISILKEFEGKVHSEYGLE